LRLSVTFVARLMQEFASSLLRHEKIVPSQSETAKTVARIRQFLDARKAHIGQSHGAFLDALLVLWGTVSDLTQRQEHGGQKEGKPLGWEDARLVVLNVIVTMYEIDAVATT